MNNVELCIAQTFNPTIFHRELPPGSIALAIFSNAVDIQKLR